MEILITNTEQEPIEIEWDDWSLERFKDAHRASQMTIQCARRVPTSKFARIEAREDKNIIFRGYIKNPSIKSLHKKELTCKGDEDLLLHRFSGRYSLTANVYRLIHPFQSDAPSQTPDAYGVAGGLGLLFTANSHVPCYGNIITTGTPHYDWVNMGSWIYKIPGLGTNSRIGTKRIFLEGLLLPRVADWTTMGTTDICSYADASDLYIRNNTYTFGFGPRMMVLAENAYDTNVRMGIIDTPETELAGNLQMNFDRILDSLLNLAEYYGLNPRFRYDKDGHTYLDALSDPVDDEFILGEDHIQDVKQAVANEPAPNALIGLGVGSRDCQHVYSPADHTWKGTWYEDTYSVPDGFVDALGNLKPITDAEYAIRRNDDVFTVTPSPEWPFRPKPSDMVLLQLSGEPERSLQVASVKRNAKGKIDLELGGRADDLVDAFQAKSSLSQVYQDEYLIQCGVPINASGTLQIGDYTHGWCTGWTFTFTVPAAVFTANYIHRVTMDLSFNANVFPGTALLSVSNGGQASMLMQPRHYLLNDSITSMDITRYVYYGSASTFTISVQLMADWLPAHANCAAHPTANVSAVIRAWQRTLPKT